MSSVAQTRSVDPARFDTRRTGATVAIELTYIPVGVVEVQRRIYRRAIISVARRDATNTRAVKGTRCLEALTSRLTVGIELAGNHRLTGKYGSGNNQEGKFHEAGPIWNVQVKKIDSSVYVKELLYRFNALKIDARESWLR